MRFRDREHAGRVLAERLQSYAGRENLLVLGLPRGGVPVAFEVARELAAPLDVFVVRKLGLPGQEELAMGAIATGGVRVLNDEVVEGLGIDEATLARAAAAESAELERREHVYRGERGPLEIAGRTVLLVDDGLATGSTMRAAALAVRAQDPEKVAVAVPVAAEHACQDLREDVDEIVCVSTPDPFMAIGLWYDDFSPTSDDEVRELLARSEPTRSDALSERAVSFLSGDTALEGSARVPSRARGIVVFAHGSGSGRHSPRNRHVADVLNDAGLATLLIDLLSDEEERIDRATGELRFDVGFLAERLLSATDWVAADEATASLPIGYFGASTGAAAALIATAERPATAAVVSRGGRPDLADEVLDRIAAPTLLIVGERDFDVLELNRRALDRLPGEKALEVVPGATHLFEEPGALDEVARLARDWFVHYLGD